jgi:glycosyltransferase involved in cell wall biosynthesis
MTIHIEPASNLASVSPSRVSAPELTIVMPCLNEAITVGGCVEKAVRTMAEHFIDGEVIVADNGSTDGSVEIAERSGARIVSVAQKGYGSALAAGIASARGKYIVMGDSDDSYDFTHIPRFLERLREGDDLVMGNRFLGGIEPGAMPPLHRYLGNPLLSGIGRLLFGSSCRDFHCGLRGFNRQAIRQIDLRTPGMEFASEMVVKATLNGLKISEVPTTLSPDGRNRPPHLRSFRDGWRHLRFMLLFSPRWLFLYPGLLLMAVGLAGIAILFPKPRTVESVTFDIHSLLYAAASVLVGFQAVLFALLSRVFALTSGLLPLTKTWQRLFKYFTLEAGIVVGGCLFLAGVTGSLLAVQIWDSEGFGPLDSRQTLRMVIPAVLNLVLGCQIVMASFFLSILGLQRK